MPDFRSAIRPTRRQMLRAAGVCLALPRLVSAMPTGEPAVAAGGKRRMVCIGNMLGFYPDGFWPTPTDAATGESSRSVGDGVREITDFRWGQSSRPLERVRDAVTILSGLDHGLTGGHFAIHAFLSGVRQIDAASRPLKNVTIDQFAADAIGEVARFPSLTVGSESGIHGGCQLSWTRTGIRVPPITGPARLFEQLFVGRAASDRQAEAERFDRRQSILDFVGDQADALDRRLSTADSRKLDEYLTSVRDVERRLDQRRRWADVPKPTPPIERPTDSNLVDDLPLLYELIRLALLTDSTRIATLEIGGDFQPQHLGISGGYHALSHHGQLADRIEKLIAIEAYQCERFAAFVASLADTEEADGDGSLLESTTVLFGSGMGNANSHTNSNLPVVLAGGGFRHGRWLQYDPKSASRPPLANLFVSMLQSLGLPTDTFADGTSTLRGLA